MPVVRKVSTLALFGLFSAAALASPTLDKLTVTPASGAKAGDKVTVTIELANPDGAMCGIKLDFGDGSNDSIKVDADTKLPIVVEHTYKAAGEYKVKADGKRAQNALACPGSKQTVAYKVAPAPVAAKAAAPASPCPANWAMKGKAAKDGSFTCIPAKGVKEAKKPEKPLDCPTGTSYFTKGKTLGCEKA